MSSLMGAQLGPRDVESEGGALVVPGSRSRQAGEWGPVECPARSRPLWPSFPGWTRVATCVSPALGWTGLLLLPPPEVGPVPTPGPRGQRPICGQEVPR